MFLEKRRMYHTGAEPSNRPVEHADPSFAGMVSCSMQLMAVVLYAAINCRILKVSTRYFNSSTAIPYSEVHGTGHAQTVNENLVPDVTSSTW